MHFRPRCVVWFCLRVSFGWLISLGRIVRGCITEMGRGRCLCARPCRPARAHPSFIPAYTMCVFLAWKRRYADVRAGTQAPPLRFRLSGLHVGGWFRLGRLRVGGFICWENGAHESTPSVLYFCQPRVD